MSTEAGRNRSEVHGVDLRVWLTCIVLVAVVPVLVVMGYNLASARQAELRAARHSLEEAAKVAALAESRVVENGRQLVAALSSAPLIRAMDRDGCRRYASTLKPLLPEYANFGLVLPDGTLICDGREDRRPMSVAHRAYFRDAIEHLRFSVGDYQVGQRTGLEQIAFGMPVLDAKGKANGVVFAALRLEALAAPLAALNLMPEATVVVTDRRGIVIARHPEPAAGALGQPLENRPLLEAMLAQDRTSIELGDAAGGRRLYALQAVRHGKPAQVAFHVAVGIDESAIVAPINRALRVHLAVLGLTAAAALCLAWYGHRRLVLHPTERLLAFASRVATGDLAARLGGRTEVLQFKRLGAAMDAMVVALQQREARLKHSESRFRTLAELSSDWYWEQDEQFRFVAFPGEDVEAKAGMSVGSMVGRTRWELGAFGVTAAQWASHRADLEARRPFRDFVYGHRMQAGWIRWVSVNGTPRFDADGRFAGYHGTSRDITEKRRAEERVRARNRVLELVASGAPLGESLACLARAVEEECEGAKVSVLMMEDGGESLRHVAAPSLPAEFVAALDGLPVGPSGGICGNAAHSNAQVVVADVGNDPRTAGFRELAARSGIGAGWSTPLRSGTGEVIGTFALYYSVPMSPPALHEEIVKEATGLANVAIEKHRIERRIVESEERYRILVESSPDAIFMQLEGRIEFANAAAARVYGAARTGDMIGRKVLDLVRPSERELVQERLRQLNEESSPVSVTEIPQCRLDGSEFLGEIVSTPISYGGRQGSLTIVRDVTLRRATEAALRDRDRFFAISQELLCVAGQDGMFRHVNPAFTKALDRSEEDLLRTPFFELIHPDDAEPSARLLERVRAGEQVESFVNRLKRADGSYRWFEWSVSPDAGDLLYAAGRDVTQRLQAEDDLRRLNAELEDRVAERTGRLERLNLELEAFSYSVSHDLRAPLRGVRIFSELLLQKEGPALSEHARHCVERIRAGAEQMNPLIDDLLKLARVTRAELRRTPVDLSAMAAAILAELAEASPGRKAQIVVQPGLLADCDQGLLKVVLQNLLDNAWKFSSGREDARIEFGLVLDGGLRTYFVRDNGAGFDMRFRDKLFGVFQRLHDAREFPGTGVGLATVKRIIEKHGGSIRAESAPGAGTTFHFTLGEPPAAA